MRGKWIFIVPLAILGIVAATALGGGLVMLLWNWLMPALIGASQVTFWQALGLLALCRILFGGRGWHGSSPRGRVSRRISERISDRMSERMAERMEHMTPEERDRFRERMRERWGFGSPSGERKES